MVLTFNRSSVECLSDVDHPCFKIDHLPNAGSPNRPAPGCGATTSTPLQPPFPPSHARSHVGITYGIAATPDGGTASFLSDVSDISGRVTIDPNPTEDSDDDSHLPLLPSLPPSPPLAFLLTLLAFLRHCPSRNRWRPHHRHRLRRNRPKPQHNPSKFPRHNPTFPSSPSISHGAAPSPPLWRWDRRISASAGAPACCCRGFFLSVASLSLFLPLSPFSLISSIGSCPLWLLLIASATASPPSLRHPSLNLVGATACLFFSVLRRRRTFPSSLTPASSPSSSSAATNLPSPPSSPPLLLHRCRHDVGMGIG